MGSTKKGWSYSAGKRGRNRVRVFEDSKTRVLTLEYYEPHPTTGVAKRKRISLGHRNRTQAEQQADEAAARLGKREAVESGPLKLHKLFEMYLGEVTARKSEGKQGHDRRAARMFLTFFGTDRLASTLNVRDWDRFIQARREGYLGPNGIRNGAGVKNRQIAYDLSFLRAVLNWATLAGDGQGEPLLPRNPLAGLPLPEEKNPKRPCLSEARYQAMLEVAAEVDPRFGIMLVIAWETGHRIKSIRHLQWRDVDLEGGTVLWRSEYDKSDREHQTPLSGAAVRALERARSRNPGIGEAWIFPAPKDPTQPCSRYLATRWWKRAEALAGLEPIAGLGWHGCRRAFATDLKGTPRPDLLRLGGWKSSQTLEKCYQQPDLVTMRTALEGRRSAESVRESTVRIDSIQRSGGDEGPHPGRKVQAGQ